MPLTGFVARPAAAPSIAIALSVLALFVVTLVLGAHPVSAADVSSQISANRKYIAFAEKAMRSQDAAVARLDAQHTQVKKEWKNLRANAKQLRKLYAGSVNLLRAREARLAEAEARYDSAAAAPDPEAYKEKLRKLRKDVRLALKQKQSFGPRVRAAEKATTAKKQRLGELKRLRRVAASRRNAAEASLAGRIVQMQRLAAVRAQSQTTVSLAGSSAFSWPTTGRISQPYGCTGVKYNARRGKCRHFHDGIDVVDRYGTPVRSVAPGVVAYSGWNPWDEGGGRAWIVVVVHPDGFVSRYGHLIAKQRVREGEVVHTGQAIGRMGSTGKSTGTHLHFELLINGKDVNPTSYLPAGIVNVDKSTTRDSRAAQFQKARSKAKARAQARAKPKVRRLSTEPAEPLPERPVACGPEGKGKKGAADCVVVDILTASGDRHAAPVVRVASGAEGGVVPEPGVPLPYRGASPDLA